jgi:hypothetical protein
MSEAQLVVSEPCIVVPPSSNTKPLGLLLQEADLVSSAQIEVALQDQNFDRDLKIGEILALRGWLKQQTADFFAQHWTAIHQQKIQAPLGHFLQLAGLLNEEQIQFLLSEQERIGLRLGALAVLKGWLKPTTLEFFLKHLCPQRQSESPFTQKSPEEDLMLVRDLSAEDTFTEDTFTEETLDKDTLIEESTDEEFFEEDLFDDETQIPTQLILSK